MTPALVTDYAWCRALTFRHYENFAVVSRFVPGTLRPHFWAVYAFARTVDDLGDAYPGDRLAALADFRRQLDRALAGDPDGPLFRALAHTVACRALPSEPFYDLIEANRRDQLGQPFRSFADVLEYCRYSANPVGRLVLGIFGLLDPERARLSDATCSALQIANFLQDIGDDADRGRCYLPVEDLQHVGLAVDDILARRPTPALRAVIRLQADRAAALFAQGARLEQQVPWRLRLQLRLYRLGGEAILGAVRRPDYDPFRRRPRLSPVAKAGIALKAVVAARERQVGHGRR
ncbi:MAG: squalene synthase HpnC [Actinomycetia bacterium]|nr:squalene synthase HpnC [Actinomycetes bacterium]